MTEGAGSVVVVSPETGSLFTFSSDRNILQMPGHLSHVSQIKKGLPRSQCLQELPA